MDSKLTQPELNELPSSFADRLGIIYSSKVNSEHKKTLGQFFTPLKVATFMAEFCILKKNKIKILDPGCGIGILSCTLIEKLLQLNNGIVEVDLVAFETDNEVLLYTDACFD